MVEKYKIVFEVEIGDNNEIVKITRDNVLDYYTYKEIMYALVDELMTKQSNIVVDKKKRKKKTFTEFIEENKESI